MRPYRSMLMLLAVLMLPAIVRASDPVPYEWTRTGSLDDKVGGDYLGELREEYVADSPAMRQERSVRLSLLSDGDPLLELRLGMGRLGLEVRGSLRRALGQRDDLTYSLNQSDRNYDGIFETQTVQVDHLGGGKDELWHRHNVFMAASVTAGSVTVGLGAQLFAQRERGVPAGQLLPWPVDVTVGSLYGESTTTQTDLGTGSQQAQGLARSAAHYAVDRRSWLLGPRVAWRGPVYLRLATAFGLETEEYRADTTSATSLGTGASETSLAVSELASGTSVWLRTLSLAEIYVPLKVGLGLRGAVEARMRSGFATDRRTGTIKERVTGVALGTLNVARDRVYEWVIDEDSYAWQRYRAEAWTRAQPFGDAMVGEWLMGFGWVRETHTRQVQETLTSTIRDAIDNGNGIEDAGDLFKRGTGATRFERRDQRLEDHLELWSRVGSTFHDESLVFVRPAMAFHKLRDRTVRSVVSQTNVAGSLESDVGTLDNFEEPAAFQGLQLQKDDRSAYVSASIDAVVDWRPVQTLSLMAHLQLDPLAGSGRGPDPSVMGGWLSRFGAEVTYTFP